jgi:CheY-like chemotaxis protein
VQEYEFPSNKKYKVLLANDEQMQLYILNMLFYKNDFEVTTAINGHEAYEYVVNSLKQYKNSNFCEAHLFDVIVLDLNMPISDGYESCKNIQNLYLKNKIFKMDMAGEKNDSSCNSISRKRSVQESDSMKIANRTHLKLIDFKPYVIACSSEVLNSSLQKQLDQAGFDGFY